MGKQTQQQAAKRRQKRDAHKKLVRKIKAKVRAKQPKAKKAAALPEGFVQAWKAHGVNCILSNYDEGIWDPLFEEIYVGQGTPGPDQDTLAKRVLDKFGADHADWPPEARAALAWLINAPNVIELYFNIAMARLKEAGESELDALKPHNSTVWKVFQDLKNEIAARTA
jgi:hypothetical protein